MRESPCDTVRTFMVAVWVVTMKVFTKNYQILYLKIWMRLNDRKKGSTPKFFRNQSNTPYDGETYRNRNH